MTDLAFGFSGGCDGNRSLVALSSFSGRPSAWVLYVNGCRLPLTPMERAMAFTFTPFDAYKIISHVCRENIQF